MSNLAKYFTPAAVVLAIAVAVCSFLLFQQRTKFISRAEIMAKGLVEITRVLNQDAQTSKFGDISFTSASQNGGKEGGSLGWEANKKVDYSASNNDFKKKIDSIISTTEEIHEQRVVLREKVLAVATALNCPDDMKPVDEEMAGLETAAGSLDKLEAYAGNVAKRGDKYVERLNQVVARTHGKNMPAFSTTSADGGFTSADNNAFNELEARLEGMNRSFKVLIDSLMESKQKVDAYDWNLRDDTFRGIDYTKEDSRLLRGMQQYVANMELINGELQKFEELKKKYALLEDQKENLQDRVDALESDNAKQKELIDQLIYQVFPGGEPPRQVEAATEYANLDSKVVGVVMDVDRQYNLVFLNLNQAQVMPGLKLAIISGDKYVGTVRITEADAHSSIATWINGDISNAKRGNNAIFSDEIIQDTLVPRD